MIIISGCIWKLSDKIVFVQNLVMAIRILFKFIFYFNKNNLEVISISVLVLLAK